MPILVKGVLTAEDGKNLILVFLLCRINFLRDFILIHEFAARLAVQSGAAGIIVSNHGARQLDYVPATISALEEASFSHHVLYDFVLITAWF